MVNDAPPEAVPEKRPAGDAAASQGEPSNEVYNRVGDEIKQAAHDGVRRGLTAKEIVREIVEVHGVHLNVGELRMLLAARRVREKT